MYLYVYTYNEYKYVYQPQRVIMDNHVCFLGQAEVLLFLSSIATGILRVSEMT